MNDHQVVPGNRRTLLLYAGLLFSLMVQWHCATKPHSVKYREAGPVMTIKKIHWDSQLSTPVFIQYETDRQVPRVLGEEDWTPLVIKILKGNQETYKLNTPAQEVLIREVQSDPRNFTHIHCGRVHRGIEIFNDQLIFHFDEKGRLSSFQGRYHASLPDSLSFDAGMEPDQMKSIVAREEDGRTSDYELVSFQLVYYPVLSETRPAYRLEIKKRGDLQNKQYILDAETGNVLHRDDFIRYGQ